MGEKIQESLTFPAFLLRAALLSPAIAALEQRRPTLRFQFPLLLRNARWPARRFYLRLCHILIRLVQMFFHFSEAKVKSCLSPAVRVNVKH